MKLRTALSVTAAAAALGDAFDLRRGGADNKCYGCSGKSIEVRLGVALARTKLPARRRP